MATKPTNVVALVVPGGVKVTWRHPGDTKRGFRIDLNRKSAGLMVDNGVRAAIVPLASIPAGKWSVLALYNTPPNTPPGVINLRSDEVAISGAVTPPAPEPEPDEPGKAIIVCTHAPGDFSQWPLSGMVSGGLRRWPWAQTVVGLDGNRVGRFEAREGMNGDGVKVRTEVGDISVPDDSEWWYSWRTFIDPAWRDNGRPFYTITQFHQNPPPDAEGWGPPPVGWRFAQNQWRIWQWFYKGDHPSKPIYEAPGQKGVWVNWRVHAKWSTPGLLEIWRDGKLVVSRTGKVCNAESRAGPFFKCGIYRGPGDPNTQILYHDDYRRGLTRESVA